jgi:urease accessory protein
VNHPGVVIDPAVALPAIVGTDDGRVRIRAERIGSRTAIVNCFRSVPFHIGMPSDRAGTGRAGVILQNVGPGTLPGDRLGIDLEAGPGAWLEVRGQGASRIHPSPGGQAAEIEVRLRVAAGGVLIYGPGELIPYRDAVLRQRTVVEVERGGRLALMETLTRGREAMGERDAYTLLDLGLRASHAGRPCLVERARLEPAARSLQDASRHGPFAVSAALYLIGEGWTMPPDRHGAGDVTWAIDGGEGYLLARALGPTTQAVTGVLQWLLAAAS